MTLLPLLVISSGAGCATAPSNDQIKCQGEIEHIIHGIRSSAAPDASDDMAENLARYLHYHPQCGNQEKVVDDITRLLSSPDDSVRWGAAIALANIGPPAVHAVPTLKSALKESDVQIDRYLQTTGETVLPMRYSGQAIREALRKITGEQIPDYNESH